MTGLVAFAVEETRSVSVASRYTGFVKASVIVGEDPVAFCWSGDASRLYCANSSTDDVTVLSGDGLSVQRTLPVGNCPFCFAYSPVRRRLYVGNLNSSLVYVIKDTVGGIEEQESGPAAATLLRAVPSAFSQRVVLSGITAGRELLVYDRSGREVRVLTAGPRGDAGWSCLWDGRDGEGRALKAGVYVAMVRGEPQARAKLIKLD